MNDRDDLDDVWERIQFLDNKKQRVVLKQIKKRNRHELEQCAYPRGKRKSQRPPAPQLLPDEPPPFDRPVREQLRRFSEWMRRTNQQPAPGPQRPKQQRQMLTSWNDPK